MNVSDPLERKAPDEPHFGLVGRDPIGYLLGRMWLAYTLRDFRKVAALDEQIKARLATIPRQPNKEAEKAASANIVLNKMEEFWRRLNAPAEIMGNGHGTASYGSDNRIQDRRGVDEPYLRPKLNRRVMLDRRESAIARQSRLTQLKNSRPPAEPDEAQ